jgi:hypothetical protein
MTHERKEHSVSCELRSLRCALETEFQLTDPIPLLVDKPPQSLAVPAADRDTEQLVVFWPCVEFLHMKEKAWGICTQASLEKGKGPKKNASKPCVYYTATSEVHRAFDAEKEAIDGLAGCLTEPFCDWRRSRFLVVRAVIVRNRLPAWLSSLSEWPNPLAIG